MPYVREVRSGGRSLRLISCGSAMYDAKGPRADDVVFPSVMGLVVRDGRIKDVTLHRAARQDAVAKPR